MELPPYLVTPGFWIASAAGSVAVSVLANLLTPKITTLANQWSHGRKSSLRNKQIITLQRVIEAHEDAEERFDLRFSSLV